MDSKNFKVGDKVWFWERWPERPVFGTIEKIYITGSKLWAELNYDNGRPAGRFFDYLFETKEDLLEFKKKIKQNYYSALFLFKYFFICIAISSANNGGTALPTCLY